MPKSKHMSPPSGSKKADYIAILQRRVTELQERLTKDPSPSRQQVMQRHIQLLQARIARLQSE